IIDAVKRNNVLLAVAHVLRYTRYTQKLKSLLDDGVIGDIVSMQHLEPVGYWHQAHSFVRGNWRNEAESSFMLLQKSCH
ncbi:gfo/Idh/MocA family oxidoreductase, partial [Salmonella enterica subsp. enterica serovar Yoruba]|nr:gfo/Idh/MocA family oxidoreductase [Salmonella enterica subsp. enterica serovar Yoruba]